MTDEDILEQMAADAAEVHDNNNPYPRHNQRYASVKVRSSYGTPHLYINYVHHRRLCPECIEPGTLRARDE